MKLGCKPAQIMNELHVVGCGNVPSVVQVNGGLVVPFPGSSGFGVVPPLSGGIGQSVAFGNVHCPETGSKCRAALQCSVWGSGEPVQTWKTEQFAVSLKATN